VKQEDKISFQVREHIIVLCGGILIIGFCLFILVMGLRYPSAGANRLVFALVLAGMLACGVFVCIMYFHRALTVEEMKICYVNIFGRRTSFSLDDIGYCKLGLYGSKREPAIESLVLYNLLGEKLCKLEMNMTGARGFLQYLLDNQVKLQWPGEEKEGVRIMEPMLMEKTVCFEEISKSAEAFYDKLSLIFGDWERQHQRFEAQWEFGFVEYVQGDITPKKDMWQWESTANLQGKEPPEEYICIVEAYLKRKEAWVMDKKGHVVGLVIPYIWQNRSYQVGESRRIRKMDEAYLQERLLEHLKMMTKELPRHSYHTQFLTLAHELKKTAGRSVEIEQK
jgi:hypothetical protein